jgi:hypothetical protein
LQNALGNFHDAGHLDAGHLFLMSPVSLAVDSELCESHQNDVLVYKNVS